VDEGQPVGVVDGDESDPFEDFNLAMGAAGDATPYPLLAELRQSAPVHVGMPDLGLVEQDPDNPMFTAYSYDAVSQVGYLAARPPRCRSAPASSTSTAAPRR